MRDLAYCGLNRVCCYNNGEPLFQSSFLKRAVIFAKEGYTWLWTLQSLTCWLEEFPLLKLSFTGETLLLQIFEIYLGFILECLSFTLCHLLVSSDISDKYCHDFSTASTRQVFWRVLLSLFRRHQNHLADMPLDYLEFMKLFEICLRTILVEVQRLI